MKNAPSDREELAKWLKLTLVHGLGPKKILQLFNRFENLDEITAATTDKLLRTGVFTSDMVKDWEKLKTASNENYLSAIDFCFEKNIHIMPLISSDYPEKLLRIGAPPPTLFLWGDFSLLKAAKTFAIVGSREANTKALNFAYDCAKGLGNSGFTIVSGGAKGIDTMAHKGAIDSEGKTIVVFGTGFSRFYPEENKGLFESIKNRGLLISEHLPNFPGSRFSFLQRNRITSALSDGLLFCAGEALNSGTATQVRIAYTQKVPIFCPAMDLDIVPNIGVQDAIVEYNAKQIHDVAEILSNLKEKKMARHATLNSY